MYAVTLKAERARTEEQLQQMNEQLNTELWQIRVEIQQKDSQIYREVIAKAHLQEDKRQLTAELNSVRLQLQVINLVCIEANC